MIGTISASDLVSSSPPRNLVGQQLTDTAWSDMEEASEDGIGGVGGGGGGGGGGDADSKPTTRLSHTQSLPMPKNKANQRSASEEARILSSSPVGVVAAASRDSSNCSGPGSPCSLDGAGGATGSPKQGKPMHPRNVGRSQSVRTKGTSNRVSNHY